LSFFIIFLSFRLGGLAVIYYYFSLLCGLAAYRLFIIIFLFFASLRLSGYLLLFFSSLRLGGLAVIIFFTAEATQYAHTSLRGRPGRIRALLLSSFEP
ncbi:MAG: hypothetical protein KAW56_10000, partial [Candidatus Marinimicrobia bacterium]|nr:hypothetical protein [Candidatus Neomarinimicrobiota bacterium]